MRIFLTGAKGQLGYDIKKVFGDCQIVECDLPSCDITNRTIINKIIKAKPDLVVHAGAYTNVSAAQADKKQAFLVNEIGSELVAQGSQQARAKIAAISTDFVFSGQAKRPYLESDQPSPINVYGQSKLAGELAVKKYSSDWLIVRTSWLFGGEKAHKNFVTAIVDQARQGRQLRVVNDEAGSPTWAYDLAKAIRFLAEHRKTGLYHVVNAGQATRFEQAKEILKLIKSQVEVKPISTRTIDGKVPRPSYSVLSIKKLEAQGFRMPPWRKALANYLNS